MNDIIIKNNKLQAKISDNKEFLDLDTIRVLFIRN